MMRTATALAFKFGATSLFALANHHNDGMYLDLGYIRVEGVGGSGDFLNPGIDYSTVMMVPNVATLEYAAIGEAAAMRSIRENGVPAMHYLPERQFAVEQQVYSSPVALQQQAVAA